MTATASVTLGTRLAGRRLPRRFGQLALGLTLYGVSVAMLIRAGLGTMPWSVLEVGIAEQLDLGIGTVIVLVSFAVLLLWLPLRQRPGIGTVANSLWVGPATGITLALLPEVSGLAPQLVVTGAAILLNGLATGLYVGARLGPGPRDGLMTGLHARTGWSLRLIRTGIEITVVATGFVLGGVVGVGTLMYALAIGPLVQVFLPRLTVVGTPSKDEPACAPIATRAAPTASGPRAKTIATHSAMFRTILTSTQRITDQAPRGAEAERDPARQAGEDGDQHGSDDAASAALASSRVSAASAKRPVSTSDHDVDTDPDTGGQDVHDHDRLPRSSRGSTRSGLASFGVPRPGAD